MAAQRQCRRLSHQADRPPCRHCQCRVAARPRGLCYSCYESLDIRHRYQSDSKFARRGLAPSSARRFPAEPTDAPPGSSEKVKVLCARASAADPERPHLNDKKNEFITLDCQEEGDDY